MLENRLDRFPQFGKGYQFHSLETKINALNPLGSSWSLRGFVHSAQDAMEGKIPFIFIEPTTIRECIEPDSAVDEGADSLNHG
jgi:hypothetical protein